MAMWKAVLLILSSHCVIGINARPGKCSVEGKMTVNPQNCAKFDTCNFGRLVTRDCAPGTIYDESLSTCVRGSPDSCGGGGGGGDGDGGGDGGWDGGDEWDGSEDGSEYDGNRPQWSPQSAVGKCSEEGKMTVNPQNCAKFDTCNFGRLMPHDCPYGTIFDEGLHVCIWGSCAGGEEEAEAELEINELPEASQQPKHCPNVKKAEMILVVDESSSVGKAGWITQRKFLNKMIAALPIGPNAVRIGLVKFSTNPTKIFDLNKYSDAANIKSVIAKLNYKGGVTFTNKALSMAQNMLKNARPRTQKVVVVLTDGASNDPPATIAEAKKLHKMNVKVIAIGVGNTREDELEAMASEAKFVLHVRDMNELLEEDFINKKVIDSIRCITKCSPVQKADVVFLVDLSGSIGDDGFKKEKFFIKSLINSLNVARDKVRVGLVTYSDRVQKIFPLSLNKPKQDLIGRVESMQYMKSLTNTHLGLKVVRSEMFTSSGGSRSDVPHLLVVLTDGASTNEQKTLEEAKLVKASGAKVIAIGVGSQVEMSELQAIASENRFVLMAKNFDALKNLGFIKNEVIHSMSCVATELE